jgi:hypothetical protein
VLVCLVEQPHGVRRLTPWQTLSQNAQLRATEYFTADGAPYKPVYFFTNTEFILIPQSLADMLFGRGVDELGINLFQFLTARNFALHQTFADNRFGCSFADD